MLPTLSYTLSVRKTRDGDVSSERPGSLVLRLEPRFRATRVLDAEARERGVIRREGVVPGRRFVLRREGAVVWALTVRSLVRKRHRLEAADGVAWTFDTPFFWWQHLTGTVDGVPGLVGQIGPATQFWGWEVEPGRDTFDLLAAVAFMHWKWWRW